MQLSATKYSWLMKSKNPSKKLEIQVGGESYALQIQMGGGVKEIWESRWKGGSEVKKMLPSVGGGIFSGITQFEN